MPYSLGTALPGGRPNGVCLLHWSRLHLETEERWKCLRPLAPSQTVSEGGTTNEPPSADSLRALAVGTRELVESGSLAYYGVWALFRRE